MENDLVLGLALMPLLMVVASVFGLIKSYTDTRHVMSESKKRYQELYEEDVYSEIREVEAYLLRSLMGYVEKMRGVYFVHLIRYLAVGITVYATAFVVLFECLHMPNWMIITWIVSEIIVFICVYKCNTKQMEEAQRERDEIFNPYKLEEGDGYKIRQWREAYKDYNNYGGLELTFKILIRANVRTRNGISINEWREMTDDIDRYKSKIKEIKALKL